jgi:hypothetical protein
LLRLNSGFSDAPHCVAFKASSRWNSKPAPWNELPPDFVTAMIWPDVDDPYSGA